MASDPAPEIQSISIVIPCFNERDTLALIVEKVLSADTLGLNKEVLIVDDGSSDDSSTIARKLREQDDRVRLVELKINIGKGAALSVGFQNVRGDLVLIQDADLEYSPADYPTLLQPIIDGRADVVYGSRFHTGATHETPFFGHSAGNKFLTFLSNRFTGFRLTDMETCYKLFRRSILEGITIREKRFGVEPEFTAKISKIRPKVRLEEVGISYFGRSYREGKKINWKDGIRAIYCIVRYRLFD